MGLRSAIGNSLVRVGKAFSGSSGVPQNVPAAMQQAAADTSHMGFENTFAPGFPIGPYDGYQRHPRQQDFNTGYNIATRPRSYERVSFDTLSGLINNYDIAQVCIYHRIDSIRSLDWRLVARDGYEGDVSDAIAAGMKALKKPDRERTFDNWLSAWLFDVLAYDAGCLYRLRNMAGEPVGLLSIDGKSIAPLLDYWGMRPQPPAEAYVQYVQGLPWNWLTQDDIIYQPMRPHNDSPYGHAPIEIVLLNANTDIRFQLYFLQRFTEGNLPAAFANAPETWTPQEIEQFQEYWDGFMYGDQSRKHQIRWIPGGSTLAWSDEKEFTDHFSLFLMRKTASAFHVVPSDLGYTESVNRSSGESQADVQHRVGDLPLLNYIEGVLDGFLQDDLRLPVAFQFDRGEEQVDQVAQAQADKIYVDLGAISPSKVGEMRYGITDPVTIPRYVMTSRGGPVPIASLMAVAGEIDQATGLPAPGAKLPKEAFGSVEGVLPVPPLKTMSLAERIYGPSAVPPAPPPQPKMTAADQGLPGLPAGGEPAVKAGEGAGITAATGVYSEPLIRPADDDDDGEAAAPAAVAKELAAFRRYARARRKTGTWRDFRFEAAGPLTAARLNAEGRAAVAKDAADLADPSPVDAEHVYQQLLANYAPEGIAWVREATWIGPVSIPLDRVDTDDRDSWAASEPGANTAHVREFARRIESGGDVSPVIAVQVPGQDKIKIVDGHHRFEAYEKLGRPVKAYVGTVSDDSPSAPWAQAHLYQVHSGGDRLNKSAEDAALAFILFRAPNDAGKMRYLLQERTDGSWGLPGGGAHPGEDPWQAAVRESAEETGSLPPVTRGPALARTGDGQTVHTFLVELDRMFTPDMGSALTPEESAGWGWFSRKQVAALDLHPAMAETWAQVREAGLDAPGSDWAAVSKAGMLSKAEVNYRAATGARHCGNCSMFSEGPGGGSCDLVMGLIDPRAVCDRWQPGEHIPSGGTLGGTALYKASGYDLNPCSGMISLDLPDGLIQPVPGGVSDFHCTVVYLGPDVSDEAFAAACDRAKAAAAMVPGPLEGTVSGIGCFPPSDSSDGKIPAWAAIALPGAERLREALADLSASQFRDWQPHVTLAYLEPGEPMPYPLDPVPVTFGCLSVHRGDEVVRFPFGGDAVAKARDESPKVAERRQWREWPGWKMDLRAAAHWAPQVTAAAQKTLTRGKLREIASAFTAAHPHQDGKATGKREREAAIIGWLRSHDVTIPMGTVAQGIAADSAMIGAASAHSSASGSADAETRGWQPGDTTAALALLAAFGGEGGGFVPPDIAGDMEDGYLRVVARVLAGWDPDVAESELTGMLETAVADGAYAEALTVTQVTTVSGQAALSVYLTRHGMLLAWSNPIDQKSCPRCLSNAAADPRPPGIPWPSGDEAPPIHPSCFPAGVMVCGPSAVAATSRLYEGDLVTIVFADGQEVPVTPNHPVLTPDGWVAAGDLREGKQVLRALDAERVAATVCPDDRHAVARIEDVAEALREDGPVIAGLVPVAPEDFHGDGAGDHYVDVVRAARNPVGNLKAQVCEHRAEFGLAGTEGARGPAGGDGDALLFRDLAAPGGLVGAIQHGSALGFGGALPAEPHGGRAVAPLNAEIAEHPVDGVPVAAILGGKRLDGHAAKEFAGKAAGRRQALGGGSLGASPERNAAGDEVLAEGFPPHAAHLGALGDGLPAFVGGDAGLEGVSDDGLMPEGYPGDADVLRERVPVDAGNGRALLHRLAGLVGVERVSELRRIRGWSGHVYNLETVDGWYFANGIVAHNCRCALVSAGAYVAQENEPEGP